MVLPAMVKKIITEQWVKARCACGTTFEYPKNIPYKPETCGKFDCEIKHQHPELGKARSEL